MDTKKALKISLILGFCVTVLAGAYSKAYADKAQAEISKELIRFHVLANSDEDFDQSLKIKVKDKFLEEFEELLNQSESLDETREFLTDNLGEIETLAKEVIKEEGYDYPVSVGLQRDKFPTKTYGDITLPSGYYEALRIEIGQAEGANWWCVMFPPLCFVDVAQKEAPEELKESLLENMSYESYKLIDDSQKTADVKVKFKIVEIWQNIKKEKEEDIQFTKKEESVIWEKQ